MPGKEAEIPGKEAEIPGKAAEIPGKKGGNFLAEGGIQEQCP